MEARSSLCTPSVRCAVHPLFTKRLNFSRWPFSILSKTVLFCHSVSCCVMQCCVGEKFCLTSQWTRFFVNVLEGVNCSTVNCSIFSTELLWDTSISARVHCRSWLKSNKCHCFSFVRIAQQCCNSPGNLDFTFFLNVCFYLSQIDSFTVKRDAGLFLSIYFSSPVIYHWTNKRNILEHSWRCNTSNIKNLVLPHFQTLRRKMKIKCVAEYFD